MPTMAAVFHAAATNWDGTDPVGGDIRKLSETVPAIDNTSICGFSTSGLKTITVDPYTLRTVTAPDSKLGWAINLAGADGMESVSLTKRLIPAGVWNFAGTVSAQPATSLNPVTVNHAIYRVGADPAVRTVLVTAIVNVGVVVAAGVAVNAASTSQPAIVLDAGETLELVVSITATGQVGGLQITYATGLQVPSALFGAQITLPAPGIVFSYPRTLADLGPDPVDDLTRAATYPRSLADLGPDPLDALVRTFAGERSLADLGPDPLDALVRAATYPRLLADLGPDPGDDLSRIATFARALADLGPDPVDDLVRAWAGSRGLADLGPDPLDALARVATYARGLEDDISPGAGGGGGVATKRPVYVWDE